MSATRAQIRQSIARSARISASAPASELIRERFSMAALDASGTEPRWNLIIPVGKYHGPTLAPVGGSYDFTRELFASMVENWKANGSFRIPVRWGHEHEQNDDPAKAKELDRKAGNVIDLRATAAGLEGLTQWNDAGRKDITAGEFDGWSAEFSMRHLNRLTGEVGGPLLSGVALTNRPFFNLMPPVAASAAEAPTEQTNQESLMDKEELKKWALSLGLAADATAQQCISASNARVATAEARVSASAPVPSELISAAVKPLQEQVVALSASLKLEQEKGLERDVDAAVALAKQGDGKTGRVITTDVRNHILATAKAHGLDEAKKTLGFIAATAKEIPIVALGHDSKQEDGSISASAANEKLNEIANELQAKGDKAPMVTAMRLNPKLADAARALTTAVHKQN